MIRRILATEETGSVLFIRLMVGGIYLSEGIQKFVYPADLGGGHFHSIGFPLPYFSAGLDAVLQIVCAILILAGLFTRLAVVPLLIITIFSLVAIQMPILISHGLWAMLHAARTDWCMLLGTCYLLLKGGGRWSFDRKWFS
ncbi:DoxX family protein [Dinghuibacter silviterrae]|uniref:Putative membrane protein YphA (DoxX/SURF4 family) n=1 Tax=Dinghuibacter silviterrae TaxID=1539049 RepID=A0A4R8DGN4_9BACT|nr:DoxX family protein [Dinghuibacter silviterrae]TDW96276.1 putative membrane protein YphA (DoxX/SURF4 family) [Dinghuibacter silviterrae]